MLFSDALKSLTVVSNAAANTTEPSYSVHYADGAPGGANPADAVGALTGDAALTVVPAFGAGVLWREVKGLTVFNRDTVMHTITVQKVNDGTGYTVAQAALAAGESLVYNGSEWGVYTADGERKVSTAAAPVATAGASNGATVAAGETEPRVHTTILTLDETPLTLRNTEQGAGVKVYDFPLGRIVILDASGSVAMTTTSVILDTLNGAKTCNWGIGTTTQANATLATTEQDILQVEDITSSATINVAGAASAGVGTAMTLLDGSETAIDAFLNVSIPTADDIDADATVTLTGEISISWVNLDE